MKESFVFDPKEYRDKLAKEIKSEPKEQRAELLKAEKESDIWHSAEGITRNYKDAEEYHEKVLKKLHSKEVKDLQEANLIVSREYAYNLEKEVEQERCLASFTGEYGGLGKQPTQVGMALSGLPFKEAFEYIERLTEKVENNLHECCGGSNKNLREKLANAFFNVKVKTPEDLQQFMGSSLRDYVSEWEYFDKAIKEKWETEIVRAMLKKLSPDSLANVKLFGKDGLLKGFEIMEKKMILQEVIYLAEHQVEQKRKEIDEDNRKNRINERFSDNNPYSLRYLGMDESHVENRLIQLEDALAEGIIMEDYEERLKKISEAISLAKRHPSSSYVSVRSQTDAWEDKIVELGLSMEESTGHTEKIKGEGLEIIASKFGGQQIAYLNGELIGALKQATFSGQPTNGKVVSWVRHEILDQDQVTGIQDKFTVYAWEKGFKQPKEIFEDHEWSIGGEFFVSPPIVNENGEIIIQIIQNSETKVKKLSF